MGWRPGKWLRDTAKRQTTLSGNDSKSQKFLAIFAIFCEDSNYPGSEMQDCL
jgi:hypothetical protein